MHQNSSCSTMSEYKLSWVRMICVVFHLTQQNNEQDLETAADFQKPVQPLVFLSLWQLTPEFNDEDNERKYRPQMVRYLGLKCYQSYVSFLALWSPECGCFRSATKSSDSALIGCTTISCTRHTAIQKTNQQKRFSPFLTPFHHICHIRATLVAGTAQIPMRFPVDVSRLCSYASIDPHVEMHIAYCTTASQGWVNILCYWAETLKYDTLAQKMVQQHTDLTFKRYTPEV